MADRRRTAPPKALGKLHSLEDQPDEQADYAISLLQPKQGKQVIQGALQTLIDRPSQRARQALTTLYHYFAEHEGMNDIGAYQRTMILHALRPSVRREDIELLTQAVTTYEFPPPAFTEEAGPLRAAALIILNEIDDEFGRLFAAGLLGDMYTQPMSGEPAMTAVTVLATLDELLPLYQYVMQPLERMLPEVTAECLRRLDSGPDELIPHLLTRFGESEEPLVRSGLFDLLIGHRTGPHELEYLATFLSGTDNEELYRYVVMTMVASGKDVLRQLLVNLARYEQHPFRVAALIDALGLLGKSGEDELVEMLRKRLDK